MIAGIKPIPTDKSLRCLCNNISGDVNGEIIRGDTIKITVDNKCTITVAALLSYVMKLPCLESSMVMKGTSYADKTLFMYF